MYCVLSFWDRDVLIYTIYGVLVYRVPNSVLNLLKLHMWPAGHGLASPAVDCRKEQMGSRSAGC